MVREEGEMFVHELWYPLLTFPILAVHTPDDVEVEIIDEAIEAIDFDDPVDLVGITSMTHSAPRAYQVADEYRKRGIKTVMGGFHASALPEEALEHVDTVVIGEGEETWPVVVEDFKKRQLKTRYTSPGLFDMTKYKIPRVELLTKYLSPVDQYKPPYYPSLNVIEVSRGCPNRCSFCAVTNFHGARHRFRRVEDVLNEIRHRKLQNRMRFFPFCDDNLYGSKTYFIELLKGLKKLNINWFSQISINVARSPDLLRMMEDSGCQTVCFGIESINQQSIDSVNKFTNKVEQYDELFERVKKYKINIAFTMILGLDYDDETIFEKTYNWLEKHLDSIILVNPHILTPYPGTPLYRQLIEENRIIDRNWSHYDHRQVVYQPRLMSPETLLNGYRWLMGKVKAVNYSNWQKRYQRQG